MCFREGGRRHDRDGGRTAKTGTIDTDTSMSLGERWKHIALWLAVVDKDRSPELRSVVTPRLAFEMSYWSSASSPELVSSKNDFLAWSKARWSFCRSWHARR